MKPLVFRLGLIVLTVLVVHGSALRNGLLLDDFNHRAQLRDGDYSFRSLVEAAHLGGHGRRVEMWWQTDADLRFFRPLAFGIMRLEYQVGRWSPMWMHLCSLAWAVVGALLVMRLAEKVAPGTPWPTLAGLLFVIHPANVLTIQWIACQNEQMAAVFLLAGLLAYGRYAHWWSRTGEDRPTTKLVMLLLAFFCFVAALGCRENGVIFLPLVVLGDFFTGKMRWRARWSVYAVLVGITVAYLVVRHANLGGFAFPGRPYAYPPSEPGFLQFAFDKFVYYLLGLFLYVPIVGFAGLSALRAHPVLFYGSAVGVIVLWGIALYVFRDRRLLRVWMVLAIVPLGPVLPVFASSHHLYLPTAGMVLAMVTVWKWIADRASKTTLAGKWIRGAGVVLITLLLIGLPVADYMHGGGMSGFSASSQLVVDEVSSLGQAFEPGDRMFFFNLPMLAFNCLPAIEERTGARPLHGYVLTFAPTLVGMDRSTTVQRISPNQLSISIEGDGYFSGLEGRSILEAIGRNRPFKAGETFATPEFNVEILRGSDRGVNELLFTFKRPLEDPSYHFFFGSANFAAYPLPLEPTTKVPRAPAVPTIR